MFGKISYLILMIPLLATPLQATEDLSLRKLKAIPFTEVEIKDSFWAPRREINRTSTIPVNLENLEKAGNLQNFRLAAKKATSGYQGPVYMDSDVYKALEAASYSLAMYKDALLEKRLDEIIALIAAAQQPDGYLDTYFTVKEPGKRWTNLRDWHELYCAGHMFEAAAAHFQATGKRNFLDVALRFADHIDALFGPPPKRLGYPGHPEIELALMKLWRITGEPRYFKLARFFIENRGRKFFAAEHQISPDKYDGTYWQDDVSIYEHRNIKGHAVRAGYLLSGATDVATETGDNPLLQMIHRVWRNTIEKNNYITGGIGPSAHNEGFTVDYDLPNDTAYQETCATIALAQWNHRLALLYGDTRYADVVERALYNGVLSGVSQDGAKFFYVNPLESYGTHHRREWFGTACCPPNVARTLASLGGYAYAQGSRSLWVNLFVQGSVKFDMQGTPLRLEVTTDYPWDGKVVFRPLLDHPVQFELRLRRPGWCDQATVFLNQEKVENPAVENGYIVLPRTWQKQDVLELRLAMPVRRVLANPNVRADHELAAIQRGPLVYCLEAADQPESLPSLYIPLHNEWKTEKDANLLGGVVAIKGMAEVAAPLDWKGILYRSVDNPRQVPVTAVPYYAWDNRKPGEMKVWMPVSPPIPRLGGPEVSAKVAVSFASGNSQILGINDGLEPKSSGERPARLLHWWPHKDQEEWVQYTWKQPVLVSGARVYWFDDTGQGGCRLPDSWEIRYQDNLVWKPVQTQKAYPIAKDAWCEVAFSPIKTSALRLYVRLQKEWSAGVHEWKLQEPPDEDIQ